MYRWCVISVLALSLVSCSRHGRRVEGTIESPGFRFDRVQTIGFVPDYDEELLDGMGYENLLFDPMFSCFRSALDPLGYETVPLPPAYELDPYDIRFEQDFAGYPDLLIYVTVEIKTEEVQVGLLDNDSERSDEFGLFQVESSHGGASFVSATKTKRIVKEEKPDKPPPEPEPPQKPPRSDQPVNPRPAPPKQTVPVSPPQDKQPLPSQPPIRSSPDPKVRIQHKDPLPENPEPEPTEYPVVVGHHKTPSSPPPVSDPVPRPAPPPPPPREWVRGGYLRTGDYYERMIYFETQIKQVVVYCSAWAGPPGYERLVWSGSVKDHPPAPLEFERVLDVVYALINGGHFPQRPEPQHFSQDKI